ncbi:MAG: hypothetical protein VX278_02415 [Myxococcota bacterium]|nr:hypothetical protein [Myxococcota bacterium]
MIWFLLFSVVMAADTVMFSKGSRLEVIFKNGNRFFAYSTEDVGKDWQQSDVLVFWLNSSTQLRVPTKDIQSIQKPKSKPLTVPFHEFPRAKKKVPSKAVASKPSNKQYFITPSSEAAGAGSGSLNQRMLLTTLSVGLTDRISGHAFMVPLDAPSVLGAGIRYSHPLSKRWSISGGIYGGVLSEEPVVLALGAIGYQTERYKLEVDLGFAPASTEYWVTFNLKGQFEVLPRFSLMSETILPTPIDCFNSCYVYGNFTSINGGRILLGKAKGGFSKGALGLDLGVLSFGSWGWEYGAAVDLNLPWIGLGWYY